MTDPADAGGTSSHALPRCYRHPDRETGVRCVRCDRPICPDCMVTASVGFQCPECLAEGRRTTRQPRTTYGGRATHGRADVTRVLILANIAVFAVTTFTGSGLLLGSGRSSMYDRFAMFPPAVATGEWYRLVTSMFLHFGLLHLATNMLALWIVGPSLEQALGRLRFTALYFLAGIGGSIASYAFGPVGIYAAGASGAIYGLFGAFFVIARHQRRETGGIVGLIVLNLAISVAVPSIDIRAHVGGLVIGGLVAAIFAYAPRGPRRALVQALGVAIVAVIGVAVAVARTAALHQQYPFL